MPERLRIMIQLETPVKAEKEVADSIRVQLEAAKEAGDAISEYYRKGKRTARGKC